MEVFRATPMLVQVFIIYYGLGNVFKLPDSSLNRMFWGMVAVGLNSAAYMSEVIRSGIGGARRPDGGRALHRHEPLKAMRHVILPQAVRNILPAMCNEFVTIIKETSILGMVGIVELMFRAQSIAKQTYIFLEPYVIAAIMYFIIVFPLSKIIAAVEREDEQECHPLKEKKLIEVKGLEKHFKHVEVLRGINIDICKGRRGGGHRAVRLGQIHVFALPEPVGGAHGRTDRV